MLIEFPKSIGKSRDKSYPTGQQTSSILVRGVARGSATRGGSRNCRAVVHPGFRQRGEHNRGSGGVAPSCQRIFAVFTQKTLSF